jgi:hypothetical protein
MVMMPAVTKGQKRDDQVIAAIVVGCIAARPEPMAKGVGRPYRVIDANSAHHGTPDDELHSAYVRVVIEGTPHLATQVKQQRIGEVDRIGITLQQQELPAAGEVSHKVTANAYNAGRK